MAPLSSPAAPERVFLEDLNAFYRKAWGRPWPQRSDIIYKNEIVPIDMTIDNNDNDNDNDNNDNDDNDDNDNDGYGCPVDLGISPKLDYVYFLDMMELATTFGLTKGLQADVLVILQEYLFLHKMIEMKQEQEVDAIVLTGHPGTGKTTFLLYLVLHRLEKQLSTAVQFNDTHYFIFDEHGPTVHILHDPNQVSRLQNCWALADSNPDIIQPCQAFRSHAKLVIQAASPAAKHDGWYCWAKHDYAFLIVSDLPKVMEIGAILKARKLPLSSALSLIHKWGPSIQTIVGIIMKGKQQETTVEDRAKGAAQIICNDPKSLSIWTGTESSDLAFVLPCREFMENGDILKLGTYIHSIPTEFLAGLLEKERSALTNLKLFELFSSHSFTRTAASWSLEKHMHSSLAVGREPLKIFREDDVEHLSPSTTLLPGMLAGLKNASVSSFYWVPSVTNFPGIDAVLCNNGNIYALQATVAEEHREPTSDFKSSGKMQAVFNGTFIGTMWLSQVLEQ